LREALPYWNEVFVAAIALDDLATMQGAVEHCRRLAPDSIVWSNNLAALLLLTGEKPAEALGLTLAGLTRHPRSPRLQINHALALLANRRTDEAQELLGRLRPERLDPQAAANYQWAVTELRAVQGRLGEAVAEGNRIDRALLLPVQLERLERILDRGRPG
jgi:Flp pilus assembly protein TadD